MKLRELDIDTEQKARLLGEELLFRWSHRHSSDEKPYTFDAYHFDWCQTCQDNYAVAVEYGLACSKHPEAYFDSTLKWCEGCEPKPMVHAL